MALADGPVPIGDVIGVITVVAGGAGLAKPAFDLLRGVWNG